MPELAVVLKIIACIVLFSNALLFGGASAVSDSLNGTLKTKLMLNALCGANVLALACVIVT